MKRFLEAHKRGLSTLAEAIGINLLLSVLRVMLAGTLGAGVAYAAVSTGMIDLSNNNGSRAAVAIAAPGVRAVEAKATEGLHFHDGLYGTFRAAAAKHHRAFGAYLFLRPAESGAAQARYFLAYANPHAGDIQPVVDSETGSPARAAAATYAALHTLELAGYRPILYASSSYIAGLVAAAPKLKRFRVWQAEYGPRLHLVAGVRVIAWQFTDRAHVGGVAVDESHLLVRDLSAIEISYPKPPKPPCQLWRPAPRPHKALCTLRRAA